MEKAVIDRIVDGKTAVVLVGDNEMEHHVSKTSLPDEAKEGSHLLVDIVEGEIVRVVLNEEANKEATERIANKMAQLRKRMKK